MNYAKKDERPTAIIRHRKGYVFAELVKLDNLPDGAGLYPRPTLADKPIGYITETDLEILSGGYFTDPVYIFDTQDDSSPVSLYTNPQPANILEAASALYESIRNNSSVPFNLSENLRIALKNAGYLKTGENQ